MTVAKKTDLLKLHNVCKMIKVINEGVCAPGSNPCVHFCLSVTQYMYIFVNSSVILYTYVLQWFIEK